MTLGGEGCNGVEGEGKGGCLSHHETWCIYDGRGDVKCAGATVRRIDKGFDGELPTSTMNIASVGVIMCHANEDRNGTLQNNWIDQTF